MYIYIYTYINEWIKDEKYFLCRYSEFHALRRSSGNLMLQYT